MTPEAWLFIIFGGIAIAFSVLMLLSKNAVHSALSLIVVMVCIAFFFLMLNAPFLALVQIAVYAGAIMVLFLFVIMLLGAEQLLPGSQPPKTIFRNYTAVVLTLAMSFMVAVGLAVLQGQIDLQEPPADPPVARIANATADGRMIDVYANGELVAEAIDFGDSTDPLALEAGEYEIAVASTGEQPTATAEIALEADTDQTLVAYGEVSNPEVGLVPVDVEGLNRRWGRFVIFNAATDFSAVSLVDFGSDFDEEDTLTIVDDLAIGQASEPVEQREGEINWAFVPADEVEVEEILFRLRDYPIEGEVKQLIVLAREDLFDGTSRAVALPFTQAEVPTFGGPRAIGQSLFTTYLLVFEVVALLLLAAMIGVIVLTQREEVRIRKRLGVRRRVSRPLTSVVASQVGHDVTSSDSGDQGALPESAGD